MPSPSQPSFDIPASTLRRWAFKAFLLGLFLGVAGAIKALACG